MSQQTTDHNKIQEWAEKHNATPVVVEDQSGAETSILRFDIQDDGDTLKEINWSHFFDLFESNKLALVFDPESNFNKFVSREE